MTEQERLDRYTEAIWGKPNTNAAARAVLAVADAEQERLRQWKAEATEVILGLQDLGKALGLRIGMSITGRAATEAARGLTARAEAAERALADALGRIELRDVRIAQLEADRANAWDQGHDECCAVYARQCATAVNPYRA